MERLVDLLWQLAIVGLVTFVVTFGWAFASHRLQAWNKPLRGDEVAGVARPWPPVWWLMGLFMVFLTLLGGSLVPTSAWWIGGTAFFALLAFQAIASALPFVEVRWDDAGIEGLSSQFQIGRRRMSWESVKRVGNSLGGFYFFEDHRGDRVYFSWAYTGAWCVWNALLRRRSDLTENVKTTLAIAEAGA
jgi:hypothetical protein